jgi:hypothetical protein
MDVKRSFEFFRLRRAAVLLPLLVGCGVSPPPDRADTSRPLPARPSAHPEPALDSGQPREITFDDIKLEMQKGDPFSRALLPERVTVLENRRIRIRGYILPSFQQSGLTQFVLVRDNQECCFGPGAALHDCIVVRMLPGQTADFSIRPVAVAGTFKVEELRGPDGKHLAIYALDGESVE